MLLRSWVRLPSRWIDDYRLREFRWADGGSANTAALMVLAAIAHHSAEPDGIARLTYDYIEHAANLSRPKISQALRLLEIRGLLKGCDAHRSEYQLQNLEKIDAGGWAKFPAKRMYTSSGKISPFQNFRLRSKVELDALKLFYLFAARRGTDTNAANISYDKIEVYTAIERNHIRAGISLLIENLMVQTEQQPSSTNEHGVSHAYRICGIDPRVHPGTTGRRTW